MAIDGLGKITGIPVVGSKDEQRNEKKDKQKKRRKNRDESEKPRKDSESRIDIRI